VTCGRCRKRFGAASASDRRDAAYRQGAQGLWQRRRAGTIEDDAGGTYRAVYTARFATAIYVLHVFQKKSKQGRETPQRDMNVIKERLKRAGEIHAAKVKESKP
jgi:phage-related protein